jgi:hypothetical protein
MQKNNARPLSQSTHALCLSLSLSVGTFFSTILRNRNQVFLEFSSLCLPQLPVQNFHESQQKSKRQKSISQSVLLASRLKLLDH